MKFRAFPSSKKDIDHGSARNFTELNILTSMGEALHTASTTDTFKSAEICVNLRFSYFGFTHRLRQQFSCPRVVVQIWRCLASPKSYEKFQKSCSQSQPNGSMRRPIG